MLEISPMELLFLILFLVVALASVVLLIWRIVLAFHKGTRERP